MTAIAQQSVFASAAHILRAPSLQWLIDSSGAIREDEKRIYFGLLAERYPSLSGGEQALVGIAQAIWRDDPVPLDLMNLDDPSLARVLEAVVALRPRTAFAASSIANEAIGLFIERMDAAGIYLNEANTSPADSDDIAAIRAEAVQEIRQGMAVRDEDIR